MEKPRSRTSGEWLEYADRNGLCPEGTAEERIEAAKARNCRVKENGRRFYWRHREEICAKQRAKYRENPEKYRVCQKHWEETHREERLAYFREYRHRNRERIREYNTRRREQAKRNSM